MSDADAATVAKCLPWLARVIEDELIPLLREVRDRLPRTAKPAPSPYAQPELPGIAGRAKEAVPSPRTQPTPETPGVRCENGVLVDADGTFVGVIADDDIDASPLRSPPAPPKPRAWGNTVKVFDLIADRFAVGDFRLGELAGNEDFVAANRIGVASFSRILSTCVRAGAIKRQARDLYNIVAAPTDLIRARIEDAARKGNLHNKQKEQVA